MSQAPECRFLESEAEISGLRPEWESLSGTSSRSDLLLSYPWYDAWRRVFGGQVRNGVIAVRRDGALIAVMPIMIGRVWRSPSVDVRHDYKAGDDRFLTAHPRSRFVPVRQLSPVLSLEATTLRGGPLTSPGNESLGYEAILRFIRDFSGWDVAVFPLPESIVTTLQEMSRKAGIQVRVDRLNRPMYRRTELPPWDSFLKQKQRHFRKRFEEAVKRAHREGLVFETFVGHGNIGQGLDVLAEVAKRSWKADGREGQAVIVPYTSASQSFFEALCLRSDRDVVPVVSAIFQGAEPKAALLSAAFGKSLVLLLTFYDPTIKHVSLGRLLIKMAYEWASANGMTEIDFNSNNPFAGIYADHHDLYHNLTLFKGSLYGRFLYAVSRTSLYCSRRLRPQPQSQTVDPCATATP